MKLSTTMTMVFLLAALAGCRVTDTQQFSISEPFTRLVVISQVGDITISGGAGVEFTAEKFAEASTRAQARHYLDQIEVTYEVANNICTITVRNPDKIVNTAYGGANLVISGVEGLPLDIKLNVGSIQCASMNGGTITNDVGDITVAAATGDIQLAISTGAVSVEDYTGGNFSLRTDLGNAGIHISGAGSLEGFIKTEVGKISCDISKNRSTSAQLKTGVGDISITGITDFTKSGFTSREASFNLGAADGTLTMETGPGDIEVNVF